jgi:putative transposase
VSQRRACDVLGQPRSTQRYKPTKKSDEPKLLTRIFELVAEFPRYGYRQVTRLLRAEGWRVNAKRIYRLWRQEGLKVPKKKAKRRRLGSSDGGIIRRRAEHKNHVWSMDFVFDRTANGRPVKIFSMIDEYTRECIALAVDRKCTSEDVIGILVKCFEERGVPKFIRSDNGPEFISHRLREFLERVDVGTSYIEPGSPWQNGYVESFHSRLCDECLACEEFMTLAEARSVIGHWREVYNHRRPHSSLGGLPPSEFATRCGASASVAALPTLQHHNNADLLTQPVLS